MTIEFSDLVWAIIIGVYAPIFVAAVLKGLFG